MSRKKNKKSEVNKEQEEKLAKIQLLENILNSWLAVHGTEMVSKSGIPYFRIEFADYNAALTILMRTLMAAKYSNKEIRSPNLIWSIQTFLTPKRYHDDAKLQSWREIIEKRWRFIADKELGDIFDMELVRLEKENKNV